MYTQNQSGHVNLIPIIFLSVSLVAALSFGGWAFMERQDYKDNVDAKVASAVTRARQAESIEKDKQFAEALKRPLKTYTSPDQYGKVSLEYPKTWSVYNDTTLGSGDDLELYFSPDIVGALDDENSTYALRLQVVDSTYDEVAGDYRSEDGLQIAPYALPSVSEVVGVRVTGQIEDNKQGVMVILPLRDKTLKIFTQSTDFVSDFDNIILPNVSFSP